MNEFSSRPWSDLRRTESSQFSTPISSSALPGLKTRSRAPGLSDQAIRSYHLSTIFNLIDKLEDDALDEIDTPLANNLKNLGMYDVGLFAEITRYVGEGATFNVRRTIFPDSRDVVFKTRVFDAKQDKAKLFLEKIEAVLLELRILTHQPLRNHPNIVQLLAVGWQGDALESSLKWPVLIVEYADRGTLADFFENEEHVETRTKLSIFSDVVAGLEALHACLIVHGDLKLLNVLVYSDEDGSFTAKLSDFGGALLDDNPSFIEPPGTPPWTAPEYHTVRPRAKLLLSDVYALGLLFWRVLLHGGDPFHNWDVPGQNRNREQALATILQLKREDQVLMMAKKSFREQHLQIEEELVDSIFDATLQATPENRSLENVSTVIRIQNGIAISGKELPSLPNDPDIDTNVGSKTEPEINLSLAGLQFDNTSSALSGPVLEAFEHTAAHDTILERRIAAAALLARMYIGSDSFGLQQNVSKGLNYLVQAATAGSREDCALVLRIHQAFNREAAPEVQTKVSQWLLDAGARGSMTALEDMKRFGMAHEWSLATSQLRTRYCGYGDEIFDCEEEVLTAISDPFTPDGIKCIESEIKFGQTHSQDLRGYLLRVAAANGYSGAIEHLVRHLGADVDDPSPFKCRPLLFAARSGHAQALITLLNLGANPNLGDQGNDTPLHWLCAFDDVDIETVVNQLMHHGALIDIQASAFPPDGDLEYAETEYVAGTPLHRAVCRNKVTAVRELLSVGANPYAPAHGDPDRTPTGLATLLHYADILEECLGINVDGSSRHGCRLTSPSGLSLLIPAMDGGSLHRVHFGMLIRHGDKLAADAKATMSVLFRAGIETHVMNLPGQSGCNAIFYASSCLPHVIEALVELTGTSQLDQPSRRYRNNDYYDLDDAVKHRPLFEAILKGKIPTFFKLLELGANPLAFENDQSGLSALYQCAASSLQDLTVAEELCQRGVGIDDGPEDHESAFCCAVRNGCYVLADFLRSKGADVNRLSYRGLLWGSIWPLRLLGLLALNNQPSSIAGLQLLLSPEANTMVELVIDTVLNRTVLHVLAMLDGDSHDGLTTSRSLELIDGYFGLDAAALDIKTLPHENGADGSVEAQGGNTALHLAVIHANFEVIVFLLRKGASTSARNVMNIRPLDLAALSYPNFEDHFERRPIPASLKRQLRVARERRDDIMKLLLEATPGGIDQDVLDRYTLDDEAQSSRESSEMSGGE